MDDILEKLRKASETKRPHKRYVFKEDKLQMDCKYWFDMQYPRYSILLHHSPNEGLLIKRDSDGAKRKAMGMRAGFPDFIFLHPNKEYAFMGIELKSPKGSQTDHQKEYQKAITNAGGYYIVVRSLEQFMMEIKHYISLF